VARSQARELARNRKEEISCWTMDLLLYLISVRSYSNGLNYPPLNSENQLSHLHPQETGHVLIKKGTSRTSSG